MMGQIPLDPRVQRVIDETGMGVVQAQRHVRDRQFLQRDRRRKPRVLG